MIRYGKISEVDPAKGRARVNIEEDEIVTDWLPISVPVSLGHKVEFWPKVNMFVWCVMDENAEDGVIGGALYDDDNAPAVGDENKTVVTFEDGTRVTYDSDQNELIIECVGAVKINCTKAIVTASESVEVDTPTATFTGDVEISGGLNATGNIQTNGGIDAMGEIHSDTQVSAGIINLTTHKHIGVTTGGGVSGTPTP